MLRFSPDQAKVLKDLGEWFDRDRQEMPQVTVGGFAGTGKTTLIAHFRKVLSKKAPSLRVGFACYTGKAARVLSDKLKTNNAIEKKDTVGTIHSLIYSPVLNRREEIIGWKLKDKLDCDFIIIDEASMVDSEIWSHLVSYRLPVLAVGDHGQLPPIRGSFSLMARPHLTLERIHRQAENNPIISVSVTAREEGVIPVQTFGNGVVKYSRLDSESQERLGEMLTNFSNETLLLCGYNVTRRRLNSHIRQALGFSSPAPVSGDRVICLRNNHRKKIYNGMLGTIRTIKKQNETWYSAEIQMDGEAGGYSGNISVAQFNSENPLNFTQNRAYTKEGDLFDFGYALTVHKAQGSEAKKVILIEERFAKMDEAGWRRWLYTGVTRATEELYIFG
jgi:exodeoxyribonuclease-5